MIAAAHAHASAQAVVGDSTVCPAPARPAAATRSSSTASNAPVDVVIYAAATASEVRFATQPDLRVRLCGGLDSIHVIERRNLPSPVVVGTTYRDVYVAVQIFGRLNAECITRTLTGRAPTADSSRAPAARPDCASLELRGTAPGTRPPADSGRPPRR
ncbi:MAG TPA: hypothetical protein VH277_11165 [Gemmatimonadaceae bacterium]|nr:hypothetical protein [Gemmatimonadaceae bacterium]